MSAKWTVMVYMAGNNSLSDAAGDDLVEMEKVGSSDDVKVCAFLKQTDGQGARRLIVGKGGDHEVDENLGDIDSGDPQTVIDFVRWAAEKAPAERRALVLWNHGGGWRPSDLDPVYSEVRGDAPPRSRHSEVNHRANEPVARVLFKTTLRKIAEQPSRGEREICSDDGTGHSLDTIELGRICALLRKDSGAALDLLGMDACLMSNLEVAYQVRDDVTNIVGSEELEPGAGWPYTEVLRDLQQKSDMDGAELGQVIVERYVESYRDQKGQWPITQCAVATAQIDKIAGPLDHLASQLREELKDSWPELMSAQSNSVRFKMDLLDLGSLCAGLRAGQTSDAIKQAAEGVTQALAPNGYVLAEGHLGDEVEAATGISVYFPAPTDPLSKYYKDLAFAKQHKWDELLRGYARAVRGSS
jgi:Clostripain family